MKVVLFCGGMETRLRELSEDLPKPMVHIGYRPILWHVMKYYAHHGHRCRDDRRGADLRCGAEPEADPGRHGHRRVRRRRSSALKLALDRRLGMFLG